MSDFTATNTKESSQPRPVHPSISRQQLVQLLNHKLGSAAIKDYFQENMPIVMIPYKYIVLPLYIT